MSAYSTQEITTSEDFKRTIAHCINDAIGDDIISDVKSNELITQNSTPSRIWDLIHRNIHKRFAAYDVISNPTKRGPWVMMPVFERSSGIIYSLMREDRFNSLRKTRLKRRNAHYVDAFSKSLNKDLLAPQEQLSLFPAVQHQFDNEKQIEEIISRIFLDLRVPNELVKRHALILFNSKDNIITSLRCCIIDSNLNIVEAADWSRYISTVESTVVEVASNSSSAFTNPAAGLKFKQKAKDRINQNALIAEKSTDKANQGSKS